MKSDIVVSTISWIRTSEERAIVLETINALSKLEIPIVIVDGGSSADDKEKIKAIPHVVLLEAKGLTNQLILSHREAAKRGEYLFYLQSDKLEFARKSAGEMVETYRALPDQGMLIPVRTQESIDSYLSYQWQVEEFLNFFISDYIGIKNDYYAGPKIYPATLVKYLDNLKLDIGWGIEAYFYALAKRLGMKLDFTPVISTAPIDVDNEEDTKNYRLRITKWQIEGLLEGQKTLL